MRWSASRRELYIISCSAANSSSTNLISRRSQPRSSNCRRRRLALRPLTVERRRQRRPAVAERAATGHWPDVAPGLRVEADRVESRPATTTTPSVAIKRSPASDEVDAGDDDHFFLITLSASRRRMSSVTQDERTQSQPRWQAVTSRTFTVRVLRATARCTVASCSLCCLNVRSIYKFIHHF